MNLSTSHKQAILRYARSFRKELRSAQGERFRSERQERVRFFQEELKQRLADFSLSDLEAIVSSLWASLMWGNKAYLAQKIADDNGLERIRDQLQQLMTAPDPEAAYGESLTRIKGLGPASITEILTFLFPERCGIWNRPAREALRLLGIDHVVNLNKYALSVAEYRSFNRLLRCIADELAAAGVTAPDLLLVDYFLFHVVETARGTGRSSDAATRAPFDHNEIRDIVCEIGAILGFDVNTEVKVAHGAVVDVVWNARIANLGLVSYVFEVHCSGSIDSLILNLQKALRAPSVQKVVAVSDRHKLEQIQRECEGLSAEFRQALRLWPADRVLATAEHLRAAMDSVGQLGLIEFRQ